MVAPKHCFSFAETSLRGVLIALKLVREEIDFVFNLIKQIINPCTKRIVTLILSRTICSCRATTHADLATLIEPITATYYCAKHGKVCKPLFSILKWWETYTKDTIKRLQQFKELRTNTYQKCLQGDSRTIDIFEALEHKNPEFAALARKQKIKGIFSSPPYVGLIDYHEQHAYVRDSPIALTGKSPIERYAATVTAVW